VKRVKSMAGAGAWVAVCAVTAAACAVWLWHAAPAAAAERGLAALSEAAQAADRAGSAIAGEGQRLLDWWRGAAPQWGGTVAIPWVIVGLLNCFLGYRLFRLLLCLAGLAFGGLVGWVGGAAIAPGSSVLQLIVAGVGAAAGLGLAFLAYVVAMFLVGAAAATAVALVAMVHLAPEASRLVLLVPAAIGGAITLLARRPLIILATALAGGWQIVAGGWALSGRGADLVHPQLVRLALQEPQTFRSILSEHWLVLPLWGLLLVLGAIVQFRSTRPAQRER